MTATTDKLGALHDAVTEVLIKKMQGTEIPKFDEEGNETGEVVVILPSAAEIQAAAKFLADNKITCAPAEDNKLGELERQMAEQASKRASRRRATLDELGEASERSEFLSGLN